MTHVKFESDPPAVWGLYPGYSGTLAFDVGANGGMLAAILARRFGTVVAFEPCEESFDDLAGEAATNVVAVNRAVSDHNGIVTLDIAERALALGELVTGHVLAQSWGERVGSRAVPCCTLDEAAVEFGAPDFVKVDTEGHEVQVIRGGLATIERHHPRMVIEVHSDWAGFTIRGLLADYHFHRIGNPGYNRDDPQADEHYWLVST